MQARVGGTRPYTAAPMAQPGAIQWTQLFALPDQAGLSLQSRLRLAVVQAILDGRLGPGTALPSSRELSAVLGVSRNTVTLAYAQLIEEGFLHTRPRSGVYVADGALPQAPAANGGAVTTDSGSPDWSRRLLRTLSDRPTLSKPEQWGVYPYPFVYGTYDPQLFPSEDFRECCVHSLARSRMPHWTPDLETEDVPELVEQIRKRLLPTRGVFAAPEEIILTVGTQHAYYLLAEALFDRGTRVGLEEPGHPHARNSFSVREPRWAHAPVDEDGLVVDALAPVDYLFVTPSHQSPTTVTLSMERRRALLQRAQAQDFVVIEDDYEAENLYEGEPMPALKSLDRCGRVLYIGSVSKALSPALRLGYIVAPRALVRELRVLRHAMVRHPSAFLQHAYALFLSLGHHDSHTRRVNQAMQGRLGMAADALRTWMPDFRFRMPQGGASIWVQAPDGMDGTALAQAARAHGVLIEAGDVFFARPPTPCPYFRLRLSSIPADRITQGIQYLARAAAELRRT